MSSRISRASKVQHNSSGRIKPKKKKFGTQIHKCLKCGVEWVNVFNGNSGRMEKRCGCPE